MVTDAEIFDAIDGQIITHGLAVAAFIRHPARLRDKTATAAEVFGSGFFISYENSLFLITAHHVIKDIEKYKGPVFVRTMCGGFQLSNVLFCCDEDADLAVALICPALIQKISADIRRIPTIAPQVSKETGGVFLETDVAIFLGFPATHNVIIPAHGNNNFRLLGIDVIDKKPSDRKTVLTPSIKNPIVFEFKRKNIIPGLNNHPQTRTAPLPYGMSGGPVLRVFLDTGHWKIHKSVRFDVVLIGVAIAWIQEKSEFVASKSSDLEPLLAQLIDRRN